MSAEIFYLGMGSPATSEISDIRSFLFNIFRDKHILPLPSVLRYCLSLWISRKAALKSQAKYRAVGGSSPYREQTEAQVRLIAEAVKEQQKDVPVRAVFRYTDPLIPKAVRDAAARGVKRIVALPQYPQFSQTTTGSCFSLLEKECRRKKITVETVSEYCELQQFISAWQEMISDKIGKIECRFDLTHVFFLAHSIPVRWVNKGDPYPEQVKKSVEAIAECFDDSLTWSIAYQSRTKRGKWLEPEAEKAVAGAVEDGIKNIVVVPVSFTIENLETLYDLDICLQKMVCEKGKGDVSFFRVSVPYRSEGFIKGLGELSLRRLCSS